MSSLRLAPALHTLLIEDRGAQLWDGAGNLMATLPELPSGVSARVAWTGILKQHLGKGARVQFLIATSSLEIQCQAAPYLSEREIKDVVRRLVHAEEPGKDWNFAHAFDADPQAEGGHQLWVAWHPERQVDDWVAALEGVGASLVFATPWQRAFLAGFDAAGSIRFCLALEPGSGRLLLFHGRELLLMRTFRLPEDLDPAHLDDAGTELLVELLAEETSRTLQFVKQKYRGLVVDELHVVGLEELPTPLVERLGRARLAVVHASRSLPAFLIQGLERERSRKGCLNLLPVHIQDALRLRLLRLTVWTAAGVLILGLGIAQLLLFQNERTLKSLLVSAEEAREQRRRLTEEAEQAGRLRLGFIRQRTAEQRQRVAIERLERLGVRLLDVPEGVTLEKVEVTQVPGEAVGFRFEVSGVAQTRQSFSVGPLADYLRRLSAHPGLRLDPLQEVSVSDRTSLSGTTLGPMDKAVTRFRLSGGVL